MSRPFTIVRLCLRLLIVVVVLGGMAGGGFLWMKYRPVHATDRAQLIMQTYPETQAIMAQIGRPDDGTDPTGFYNVESFVPLKPRDD
jgi:hypothetical protein